MLGKKKRVGEKRMEEGNEGGTNGEGEGKGRRRGNIRKRRM